MPATNTEWWNSGGGGARIDPGANNPLFRTLSNVKDPELDARIQALMSGFDTLHSTDRLGRFTDLYDSARQAGKQYTNAPQCGAT